MRSSLWNGADLLPPSTVAVRCARMHPPGRSPKGRDPMSSLERLR
ncbi:unnamed protein product [Ciceribacter selenitireducens ATCC BAA-1503]|uniref:Uncharacterized protein n=1 Tax=Ciceribacter selenitireducens ATCC BAA-1503 TaxID=1336235 RepID=A0A376A999_9HYPH|nr:unnamed protein product [Ciceribacter selenitireducens ATCC BAA-1503]